MGGGGLRGGAVVLGEGQEGRCGQREVSGLREIKSGGEGAG